MATQVLFEPFPNQLKFIEAVFSGKYKYILFGGGIRGGKTFAGLGTLIMLCKAFPQSRWAIVRKNLPTLKRNTLPSFNKIRPEAFVKSHNHAEQTVTFTNGSQIIFFSENYEDDKELNRWRGLEVNGFMLEEANELQYQSFLKAIERAGSHIPPIGFKKPKPLIMLTVNPSWGWVKEQFYDRDKNGTLPDDWLYIPSLITDNHFITEDEDYMQSLENLPRIQYEIYVKGNWDINLNEFPWLYSFRDTDDPKTHIRPLPFLPTYPVYLFFDINADPLTCSAWQHSDRMGGIGSFAHCINEFGGHVKVQELCMKIKTKYPNSIFFVGGDRSGQNEDVGRNQTIYQIIQSCLGLSDQQMLLENSNLEHADSRILSNTIFEKYNILIDPCCVNLIADIRKATPNPKSANPHELLKNREDYKMDYFDGMRYYFQRIFNKYVKENYLKVLYNK